MTSISRVTEKTNQSSISGKGRIILSSTEASTEKQEEQPQKGVEKAKNICKLCKRKFPNEEALYTHEQFSDLHRVINCNDLKIIF